jgi:hypothetical protein
MAMVCSRDGERRNTHMLFIGRKARRKDVGGWINIKKDLGEI